MPSAGLGADATGKDAAYAHEQLGPASSAFGDPLGLHPARTAFSGQHHLAFLKLRTLPAPPRPPNIFAGKNDGEDLYPSSCPQPLLFWAVGILDMDKLLLGALVCG